MFGEFGGFGWHLEQCTNIWTKDEVFTMDCLRYKFQDFCQNYNFCPSTCFNPTNAIFNQTNEYNDFRNLYKTCIRL